MLVSASTIYRLILSAALYGLTVRALAFRRYDGLHRMAKSPQVTQPAMLLQRKDEVCGTFMTLCPASLGGNCCPQNYACATNSCYSTTSSSSPPSAPSYTYSCPTSQYLCPPSVGYGCCPDGMGCGTSRCYSTQPVTMTVTTTVTGTASGTVTTFTTTATTVRNPALPTDFGLLADRTIEEDGSQTATSSTTSVPKYIPQTGTDGDSGQDSGLSTTQLGGIIGGAVALLALVVAAACVLIRHIDRLSSQISRRSNSSKARTASKQTSLSDSESRSSRTDSTSESIRRSRARRKPRSRSTVRRNRQRRNGLVATRSGNFMTERAQGRQGSADIPLQVLTRNINCRGAVSNTRHGDIVSPTPINDESPRFLSSPSPLSDSELEASSLAQELAGTSSASTLAADLLIHFPQEIPPSDLPKVAIRPPLAYQWMRSIGLLRESENASPDRFCIEDEEWHGFYGSRDHVAGRTGLGIRYTEIQRGGFRQYR